MSYDFALLAKAVLNHLEQRANETSRPGHIAILTKQDHSAPFTDEIVQALAAEGERRKHVQVTFATTPEGPVAQAQANLRLARSGVGAVAMWGLRPDPLVKEYILNVETGSEEPVPEPLFILEDRAWPHVECVTTLSLDLPQLAVDVASFIARDGPKTDGLVGSFSFNGVAIGNHLAMPVPAVTEDGAP